jgi:hypothetical protein
MHWWISSHPERKSDWVGYLFEVEDVLELVDAIRRNPLMIDEREIWPRLIACILRHYQTFHRRLPDVFPDSAFAPGDYVIPGAVRVQCDIEINQSTYAEMLKRSCGYSLYQLGGLIQGVGEEIMSSVERVIESHGGAVNAARSWDGQALHGDASEVQGALDIIIRADATTIEIMAALKRPVDISASGVNNRKIAILNSEKVAHGWRRGVLSGVVGLFRASGTMSRILEFGLQTPKVKCYSANTTRGNWDGNFRMCASIQKLLTFPDLEVESRRRLAPSWPEQDAREGAAGE